MRIKGYVPSIVFISVATILSLYVLHSVFNFYSNSAFREEASTSTSEVTGKFLAGVVSGEKKSQAVSPTVVSSENATHKENDTEKTSKENKVVSGMSRSEGSVKNETTGNKTPKVMITEIMYNPKGKDSCREWIEIANLENFSVNLSGWKLVDSGRARKLVFLGRTMLLPKERAVIVRCVDQFLKEHTVPEGGLVIKSFFALSNKGDDLELRDEKGRVIDRVSYASEEGGDGNGKSLVRVGDSGWLESCKPGGKPFVEDEGCKPEKKSVERELREAGKKVFDRVEKSVEEGERKVGEGEKVTLLITEVKVWGDEFVELYNYGNETLTLEKLFLCYYPRTRSWENPLYAWKLENVTIAAKSFYVISVFGFEGANFTVVGKNGKPYTKGKLSNKAGSVAIFLSNPRKMDEKSRIAEEAIDVFSWGDVKEVKRGNPLEIKVDHDEGKSFNRKGIQNSGDNSEDFVISTPTPFELCLEEG